MTSKAESLKSPHHRVHLHKQGCHLIWGSWYNTSRIGVVIFRVRDAHEHYLIGITYQLNGISFDQLPGKKSKVCILCH